MNKVTLFATASVLFIGVNAAQAQTAKYAIRSLSTGASYAVAASAISATGEASPDYSYIAIPKSTAGLLSVRVTVSFDPSITLFVMQGPYGTNSTFVVRPGSTSTSFGQYLNAPLCLDGVQTYKVKMFNAAGELVSTKQLDIDLQ